MANVNFDAIDAEIKQLENEKQKILLRIKENEEEFNSLQQKIKQLKLKFPTCYSCWNHYHPKDLIKATQQDVDDYFDKNQGYTQLEVGENYCGGC
jgi:chromosome segregation ATPase